MRPGLAAVAGLGALALLVPAPAAVAHPFGEPQTATITPTATGVLVEWQAAEDDVAALAGHLGVLRGTHIVVFEDGEYDPDSSSTPAGVQLARAAPALADYLLSHVEVAVDGRPCEGGLRPVEDVTLTGATLDFDCAGPVLDAEVTITTLTDLDDAYRTLATGPGGRRRVYAAGDDTFRWTLPAVDAPGEAAESSPARSAALQLGGVGLVAAGAAVVWWAARRRPRRA